MDKKTKRLQEYLAHICADELINQVENMLHDIWRTGGESINLSVPPSTSDVDMLTHELIRRYKLIVYREKLAKALSQLQLALREKADTTELDKLHSNHLELKQKVESLKILENE